MLPTVCPMDDMAAAHVAFTEALHRGDADGIAGLYTDSARLLAPSTDLIEGRRAVAAFWGAGIAAGLADVELEVTEVERLGEVALEFGHYTLRLTPTDAAAVVDRGAYALVHRRQPDGSWRRALEMFTPTAT